jgi:hypothetical protein
MFGLNKQTLIIIAVAVVLFIFVGGFSLRKIFGRKSAQVQEYKQEKQEERAEKKVIDTKLKQSDFFNPATLSFYPSSYQLPAVDANKIAKKLKYELVWWGGRLSQMMSIFGSLSHKVQVSQIALIYRNRFGRDLSTDIVKYMTKKQVQNLYNKISQIGK